MPIVAIGSSAGGLEALQEFFSNVPYDSGIAFVVVTHVRTTESLVRRARLALRPAARPPSRRPVQRHHGA
jgi:chemotaxis response regulator CheB